MENNNSPYVYEKPINRNLVRRFSGLAGLGLVGVVGLFGGSAIASTVIDATPANSSSDPVVLKAETTTEITSTSPEVLVDPATSPVASATLETDDRDPIVSVPLQEARPKPNSVSIQLPAQSATDWGNTSSATPSAGSSGGSNSNATNYFNNKSAAQGIEKGQRLEVEHEARVENHIESKYEAEDED